MSNLLNWILWMPVIGVLGILLLPSKSQNGIRYWSLISTFITFVLTLVLYSNFDQSIGDIQPHLLFSVPWISQFNINYTLGIDGISLPMTILTGLLFFICVLASWKIEKSVKGYFALLLMLEATVFGVFFALDFFLFYVGGTSSFPAGDRFRGNLHSRGKVKLGQLLLFTKRAELFATDTNHGHA